MYHAALPPALSKTEKKLQLSLFQPAPAAILQHDDLAIRKVRELLADKIPEPAFPQIIEWFETREVILLITWGRTTKSGDFRSPKHGSPPVITINKTLNKYTFLITLIHEMAHFDLFDTHWKHSLFKRKRKILPHGKEWKACFRQLMEPFLSLEVFPEKVLEALASHMQNPRASTHSDPVLSRLLLEFDDSPKGVLLESLPAGAHFLTASGMLFRMEGKLRKRYRCVRLKDRRVYLFSPLARIFPSDAEKP